jgi:hypothetical protein
MTPEEAIRDELLIHLSKATLDSGVKLLDRTTGTAATISGTLLSAYLAALGFLKPNYSDTGTLVYVLIPPAIWLFTLLVSLLISLPHPENIDLKQPLTIIRIGHQGLRTQLILARFVLVVMLIGAGFAFEMIITLSRQR